MSLLPFIGRGGLPEKLTGSNPWFPCADHARFREPIPPREATLNRFLILTLIIELGPMNREEIFDYLQIYHFVGSESDLWSYLNEMKLRGWLKIEAEAGKPGRPTNRYELTFEGGQVVRQIFRFVLQFDPQVEGTNATLPVPPRSDSFPAFCVLSLLQKIGPLTRQQLKERFQFLDYEIKEGSIHDLLKRMVENGWVDDGDEVIQTQGKRPAKLYSITSTGDSVRLDVRRFVTQFPNHFSSSRE